MEAAVGHVGGSDPGASERLVGRNFLALGGAEVVARLLAFAATIYMARVLGAAAYGVVGFATAVILYFSHVTAFGMDVIGVRLVAEDHRRIHSLAPSILVARLLLATALAVVLALGALTLLPHPDGVVLAVSGLSLVAVAANARWIHLGLERTRAAAAARVAGDAAALALLVLLVSGPADIARLPLAQLAGSALTAVLLLWSLERWGYRMAARVSWDAVQPLVSRAWPLTVYGLLGLLLYNADLLFLRFSKGVTTAGYYAAAYTLISFISNIGLAYALSLLPTLARLGVSDGAHYRLYHTANAQAFSAAIPTAVGGYLLAPDIVIMVFGSAYAPAVPVLQVLIWSVPLSIMRDLPFVALVTSGREDRLLRLNAATVVCNLILIALLIPPYGMVGAAVATVVTEAVRLAIALGFARAEGYALTRPSRYWRAAVASLLMAAVVVALRAAPFGFRFAGGAAAYVAALVLLGGIRLRRGRLPQVDV